MPILSQPKLLHTRYIQSKFSRRIFKLSKESFAECTRSYFLETSLKHPASNDVSTSNYFCFPKLPKAGGKSLVQLSTKPHASKFMS